MAGIYLHVPFCRRACVYCDFHFVTSLQRKPEMVQAMVEELRLRRAFFAADRPLQSLYVGGGTPSVLSEAELASLLQAVDQHYSLAAGAEITLEANPDDIDRASLQAWQALGINRLSIGTQSFFADDLRWMNRSHAPEQAIEAVTLAQEVGYEAITIDLIFGLPGSTEARWAHNLDQALALGVPHLSVYALTVEEKTAMAHQLQQGQIALMEQEAYAEQFLAAHARLTAAGYEHYELSNYARPGWRAVHNSSYWEGEPYLGVGPSAHGYDGAQRYGNLANNARYLRAVDQGDLPEADRETLTLRDRYHEYLMTHLRHSRGIDPALIAQAYWPDWEAAFSPLLTQWQQQGLMAVEAGRLRLTPTGWLLSDQLISDLFMD
jgi:oxygen-independent coproporphyrinogen-3 oxidase